MISFHIIFFYLLGNGLKMKTLSTIFAVGETLPAGQAANSGDPPLPVFSPATFRTT